VVRQIFQQIKNGGAARDFELRAQRACVILPGANYFSVRRIFRYTGSAFLSSSFVAAESQKRGCVPRYVFSLFICTVFAVIFAVR